MLAAGSETDECPVPFQRKTELPDGTLVGPCYRQGQLSQRLPLESKGRTTHRKRRIAGDRDGPMGNVAAAGVIIPINIAVGVNSSHSPDAHGGGQLHGLDGDVRIAEQVKLKGRETGRETQGDLLNAIRGGNRGPGKHGGPFHQFVLGLGRGTTVAQCSAGVSIISLLRSRGRINAIKMIGAGVAPHQAVGLCVGQLSQAEVIRGRRHDIVGPVAGTACHVTVCALGAVDADFVPGNPVDRLDGTVIVFRFAAIHRTGIRRLLHLDRGPFFILIAALGGSIDPEYYRVTGLTRISAGRHFAASHRNDKGPCEGQCNDSLHGVTSSHW